MSFPKRLSLSGGRLPAPSPELPGPSTLAGQLVVFTGKLSSLGRRDARALVARLGGVTADDVNARTTMLVVGAEGFGPSPEPDASIALRPDSASIAKPDTAFIGSKSNKLKRAEELNADGMSIRIIPEDEFCRLAGVPTVKTLRQHTIDARSAGALSPSSRRPPAVSREVRGDSAGGAHQRRCVLRVRRRCDHKAGERRPCRSGVIPCGRP